MNTRTSYTLIAVLTAIGALTIVPAFALEQACPDCGGDGLGQSKENKLAEVPITVWTDDTTYGHDSTVMVEGKVANLRQGVPVTMTVISPTNNIVTIAQIPVSSDGTFATSLSTAGALWKYDGTYKIRVQYGGQGVNDRVLIELTGGESTAETTMPAKECGKGELSATGSCVPYEVSGATVTSARFSSDTNSLIIRLSGTEFGTLSVSPSTSAIKGIFMVLVDGEESNDVEIDGNNVTVMFPPGAEEIEIIGTFAIPEFGTIAALILAVAVISIIAVSAKTRLNITPKI